MPIPAPLAAALAALDLAPTCHEHPALATVEDAHAIWDALPGAQVKNLFIKDAGKQHWLVVVPGDPRMDTKALAPLIGSKRISFASADDLRRILAVEPGSVTPLAMMNDTSKQVRLVIHEGLMQASTILIHPLVNTATIELAPQDLLRFLILQRCRYDICDMSSAFVL